MDPNDDLEKNIAHTKRMADTGVDGCFITMPRKLPPEDDLMVEHQRNSPSNRATRFDTVHAEGAGGMTTLRALSRST